MKVLKRFLRNRTIVALVCIIMLLGLVGGVQLVLRGAQANGITTNNTQTSCHGHKPCDFLALTGFSSTQGLNGWSYSYSLDQEKTLTPMTYDAANNRWAGSETDCLVGGSFQHPGPSVCDAVRTWVAPNAGTATLTSNGDIGVTTGCAGTTNAAGVQIRVLQNGTQVWPASGTVTIPNGTSFAFPSTTVAVQANDQIEFVVANAGGTNACDTTNWDQAVSFVRG